MLARRRLQCFACLLPRIILRVQPGLYIRPRQALRNRQPLGVLVVRLLGIPAGNTTEPVLTFPQREQVVGARTQSVRIAVPVDAVARSILGVILVAHDDQRPRLEVRPVRVQRRRQLLAGLLDQAVEAAARRAQQHAQRHAVVAEVDVGHARLGVVEPGAQQEAGRRAAQRVPNDGDFGPVEAAGEEGGLRLDGVEMVQDETHIGRARSRKDGEALGAGSATRDLGVEVRRLEYSEAMFGVKVHQRGIAVFGGEVERWAVAVGEENDGQVLAGGWSCDAEFKVKASVRCRDSYPADRESRDCLGNRNLGGVFDEVIHGADVSDFYPFKWGCRYGME